MRVNDYLCDTIEKLDPTLIVNMNPTTLPWPGAPPVTVCTVKTHGRFEIHILLAKHFPLPTS